MASSLRNSCVGLLLLLLPCCILARPKELGKGKRFYVGFTENGMAAVPRLYVVTFHKAVNVTVRTPLYNSSFEVTKLVIKNETTIIDLDPGLCGSGTEKADKGVLVTAPTDVNVYGANTLSQSVDSYLALPRNALGRQHFVITAVGYPVLLVVAAEDNTIVRIKCPRSAGDNCIITYDQETTMDGDTLTVHLDKYQTFHAFSNNATADFSGVNIKSNRRISVFSGNKMVADGSEHLTEQMPTVNRWGTQFYTPSTPNRDSSDRFKIVAWRSNTAVMFHDGTVELLRKGESLTRDIPSGEYQAIKTSDPVLMAMFSERWLNGAGGDPFMTIINPVRLYGTSVKWPTINSVDWSEYNNTLNVIVDQSEMSGLRLDRRQLDWVNVSAVLGSDRYVHAWTYVTDGPHHLRHVDLDVPFLAVASGQFPDESYGNPTIGKSHVCRISDDPNLSDFPGLRASIPLPCHFNVTFMRFLNLDVVPVFNVSVMEVAISASNGLKPKHGRYYVEAILISVTFVMVNGDRVHVGDFSTDMPTIELNMAIQPAPSATQFWQILWATDNQAFRDELVFGKVTPTGKVKLTFRRVSLDIRFQPFNYQGSRPGLRIEVGNDATIDEAARFPATMCSLIHDRKYKLLKGLGDTANPTDAGLYAAIEQPITQVLGSNEIGKAMCTELKSDYHNCSLVEKQYAVGNCSHVLSTAPLLSCARKFNDPSKNITIEQAGFGVFTNCLKAFCNEQERPNSCEIIDAFKSKCNKFSGDFVLDVCPVD